jgi:ribosomal-protein-alanine N-acetyltransferase
MPALIPLSVAVAAVRYHLRPVRRGVNAALGLGHARGRTWNVRIGPIRIAGHELLLRSPRFADGPSWREVRIREQAHIEPWWITSEQSWDERHTSTAWTSHVLSVRRQALQEAAMPLVVVVDGQVSGECNLEWVDLSTGIAELGCWFDSAVPNRARLGLAAGRMVLEYGFAELGLRRIVAPICVGNAAAAWAAARIGMSPEGTMVQYLDVGGRRQDHTLWAATADRRAPAAPAPPRSAGSVPRSAAGSPARAAATN